MLRLGVVVHPSRDVGVPLVAVREWAAAHGAALGQIVVHAGESRVAEPVDPDGCDLLLAIGGDGTVLRALEVAAGAGCPVLGIAFGSLGALASTAPEAAAAALDAVATATWTPVELPALHARTPAGHGADAINDLVVVRDGPGQVAATLWVDGTLYGRFAGDGLIVSTQVGSGAYALAAGGPLLAPGADAFLVTPLVPHAGSIPPLVIGAGGMLRVQATAGFGGARIEVDGRPAELGGLEFEIVRRPGHVTLVGVAGQESMLAGLRRRGVISDGPRVLARDARTQRRMGG